MKLKPTLLTAAIALLINNGGAMAQSAKKQPDNVDVKVKTLLAKMTLEEKIGQLNQYTGDNDATGPVSKNNNKLEQIKQGKVGSMLNVRGAKDTRQIQEAAMQSRLKIPLLFGQDVIHGYRVTFPVPLAEAASWDLGAIELSARIAAKEAAASGLHWTFAPMVDIARDPRWGRVMEGAGEDPYLGSLIAKARVHGFQGKSLGDLDAIMACAKHFAAYGAAIAGRDYNSVDMSDRLLWEVYLPPFKAAVDAGAATFMNSFNDLNGIPATGNSYLQRDILKGKWGFTGFVVSDWGSIGEMIAHGYVKDSYDAANAAITAGSDMDMESRAYIGNLQQLVKDGKVSVKLIDDAVSRILRKKFELGLFDDPYRFSNEEREKSVLNSAENKQAAKEVAEKSIVLLKNDKQLLPLSKNVKSIAVIGPLAKSKKDMKGFWSIDWAGADENDLVSLYDGIQHKLGNNTKLLYARGCAIQDSSRAGFDEAVKAAKDADVVIMAIGEAGDMSGEAKSRSNIHIPGVQEELVKAIQATGKPVVVLVMGGRPLIFNSTADNVPAILYTWWLGSEAGNAIADVLFGDYNPAGKLPISFPRSEGQIPVFYAQKSTGRPSVNDKDIIYKSAYLDLPNSPRFAFGYGLSYTTFKYSDLKLSKTKLKNTETLTATFTLTNTGKYAGEEVAQLYLHDVVASAVRPVKELKDFKKVMLKPGESVTISFVIGKDKLSFYNSKMVWTTEPGKFELMIGSASDDVRLKSDFELVD
ncbi:beta-glucosidase BglX [Mucilaginibacter gynuensis]|uniref:beta-glucosidase n=1 Tax=Mucilaginibacter gynuensis TaxID=1302236 RepID=A0ABP8G7R6_9SPHI